MAVFIIPIVLLVLTVPAVALVFLIVNAVDYKQTGEEERPLKKKKLVASIIFAAVAFVLLLAGVGVCAYFILALANMT